MRVQYQAERLERCSQCHVNNQTSFCNLPEGVAANFESIVQPISYTQRTRLFVEGQMPRGIFIVCRGRVKLLSSSISGKVLMRIASAGEILGLSATIMGSAYESTAEALESGQIRFVPRDMFLNFIQNHGEASLLATQILSRDYHKIYDQIRSLILLDSAEQKLATLLLRWCRENGKKTDKGMHLKLSLTHNEIAQMIGVARETVSRLLATLKDRQVIQLEGASLFIPNLTELENIINL